MITLGMRRTGSVPTSWRGGDTTPGRLVAQAPCYVQRLCMGSVRSPVRARSASERRRHKVAAFLTYDVLPCEKAWLSRRAAAQRFYDCPRELQLREERDVGVDGRATDEVAV